MCMCMCFFQSWQKNQIVHQVLPPLLISSLGIKSCATAAIGDFRLTTHPAILYGFQLLVSTLGDDGFSNLIHGFSFVVGLVPFDGELGSFLGVIPFLHSPRQTDCSIHFQ